MKKINKIIIGIVIISMIFFNTSFSESITSVYYESTVDNLDEYVLTQFPLLEEYMYSTIWISGHTDNTSSTETYKIIRETANQDNEIITDLKTNQNYSYSRINGDSLYILSNIEENQEMIYLSEIIENDKINDLTRIIIAKSIDNDKKLIGYEKTIKDNFPSESLNSKQANSPRYEILFQGLGNIQDLCYQSLGKYTASNSNSLLTPIYCSPDYIKINSYEISNFEGFNVFKNIILDTYTK